MSALFFLSYLSAIILFKNANHKDSRLHLVVYLFLIYVSLSIVKSFDFGIDFNNYYISYTNMGNLGLEYSTSHDLILNYYFYVVSDFFELIGLDRGEFNFKLVIILWFILLFIIFYITADKEWRLYILLTLIFIFSSRLFWEYSSNTLRSFSSAFLLCGLFLTKNKFIRILLLILAFFIHFKSLILTLTLCILSYLVASMFKRRAIYVFISILSVLIFTSKLFLSGIINIELLKGYVVLMQESSSYRLHSNTIDSDKKIQISLYIQYLVYIIYPSLMLGFLNVGIVEDDLKYRMLVIMVFILSISFPEVFLVERFGQFIFILSNVLFVRYIRNLLFYIPFVILNIYTIYLIFYTSDIL